MIPASLRVCCVHADQPLTSPHPRPRCAYTRRYSWCWYELRCTSMLAGAGTQSCLAYVCTALPTVHHWEAQRTCSTRKAIQEAILLEAGHTAAADCEVPRVCIHLEEWEHQPGQHLQGQTRQWGDMHTCSDTHKHNSSCGRYGDRNGNAGCICMHVPGMRDAVAEDRMALHARLFGRLPYSVTQQCCTAGVCSAATAICTALRHCCCHNGRSIAAYDPTCVLQYVTFHSTLTAGSG